jgi:hypothetical protein
MQVAKSTNLSDSKNTGVQKPESSNDNPLRKESNWNVPLTHHNEKKDEFFEKLKARLRDQFKKKFYEHMTTTHLHGCPHIIRSKYRWVIIFWILLFFLLLGLSLWLAIGFYINYFSYPVVSVINKYVQEQQTFPAITICNVEPLASQTASNLIKNRTSNLEFNDINDFNRLIDVRNKILSEINQNFGNAQKQTLGISIDETIINCQFEDYPCSCQKSLNGDCLQTSQEFIWYYSYKHGNCYTFNSGYTYGTNTPSEFSFKFPKRIKTVSKSSIDYGLYLELYINTDNHQYSVEQKVFNLT